MYIILVAIVLSASLIIISRIYRSRWSRNLSVTARFSTEGVFEGERAEVIETMTNSKLLPIFWGSLQFKTSHHLRFEGAKPDHDYYMQNPIAAFSYEEVTKRLPFTAAKRGYYKLDDIQLIAGDLLFDYKLIHSFPGSSEIYVYPNVKKAQRFDIDFRKLTGEAIARRRLIEDPFYFRGIRDYSPYDSMKTINWNATARTGSLKVNQYHSTQSQQVMLLVDLDGYNKWDGAEIKEDVIRVAALLSQKLLRNGIPTGLITNAADSATGGKINVEAKSGQAHYLNLLRKMAVIDAEKPLVPFDEILDNLLKNPDRSVQYTLISYYSGENLMRRFLQFERAGISIQWILLKDKARKADFSKHSGMYVCEVEY